MDLLNIIQEIEKVDPEFQEKISPRRAAIKNITSFGSKVAVAALPFALGSLFKKAYAQQSTTDIAGILNFALTLEYLESNFYNTGLGTTALTAQATAADLTSLRLIQTDENNHVKFLVQTIRSLGATPIGPLAASYFDFTGKGTFRDVFSNITTFLAVAETFEDTGVRAYKGQAPNLLRNQMILTAALNIHSVEARHAAELRILRRAKGATLKPWITGANDTGVSAVDKTYAGEDNVMQGGVSITGLASVGGTTTASAAATEAFDEPLDRAAVLAIVTPFIR
jgi:hypothetical protein